MAVYLSPVGGVAAQFFNNDGSPLAGGLIYTYLAGTTTPAVTYTTSAGNIQHTNPIVLDSGGRVPTGEIWLADALQYKFVIKTNQSVLIATYDNIVGINSNFVNYTNSQEIQTATAGQTLFTLTGMAYAPGTNSLSVFVDGVNQYGPGAQYAYVETSSTEVTFTNGLHVGAEVKFTTSQLNSSSGGDASQVSFTGFKGQVGNVQDLANNDGSDWIGFLPAGVGAVAISSQDKMRQTISVEDFLPVGIDTTTTDCAPYIQAAIDQAVLLGAPYLTSQKKTYRIDSGIVQDTSVIVDMGNSVLDYSNMASGYTWTVSSGKEIRQIVKVFKNAWIKGVSLLADGSYNGSLVGVTFNAPQQAIENVLVTGCVKGVEFLENSYDISLHSCVFYYNGLGWNSNQTGYTNMGAALSAHDCLFAHNNVDVVNNLCEVQFFNCSFDQVQEQFVQYNINSGAGYFNSQLLFQACRFEGGGDVTKPLFNNSGRLTFRDCQFFEPLVYSYFIQNSGNVIIDGGFTRIESDNYTSINTGGTGNGGISVNQFRPLNNFSSGWRLSPDESGVINGNIETGTTAGFNMVTGNAADLEATTAITPHSGTYSLRTKGSATPNVMQSSPILIKPDTTFFLLNVFMQNRNVSFAIDPCVRFYDFSGNELANTAETLAANVTTWTRTRFYKRIPRGTAYAKFELTMAAGYSDWIYMDDFYVNQW